MELDNVGLFLIYALSTESISKSEVEHILVKSFKLKDFDTIMNNEIYVKKLTDYYYSNKFIGPINLPTPCELVAMYNNKLPECIGWDPSAETTSLQYYNPFNLPDNMSLVCISNSSILETIVGSVFGGGSGEIWKYLKYIIILFYIILCNWNHK